MDHQTPLVLLNSLEASFLTMLLNLNHHLHIIQIKLGKLELDSASRDKIDHVYHIKASRHLVRKSVSHKTQTNPCMLNGISHHYQLDKHILNL